MSGIISYVKRIGVWLCIVIACETIMIITMMLNKIPFAEIGYGIFISLFLLLILLAFDAMRYYRHYQKVKELEHTIIRRTCIIFIIYNGICDTYGLRFDRIV